MAVPSILLLQCWPIQLPSMVCTFLLSKPFGSGKLGEDKGHEDLTGLQYFKMP